MQTFWVCEYRRCIRTTSHSEDTNTTGCVALKIESPVTLYSTKYFELFHEFHFRKFNAAITTHYLRVVWRHKYTAVSRRNKEKGEKYSLRFLTGTRWRSSCHKGRSNQLTTSIPSGEKHFMTPTRNCKNEMQLKKEDVRNCYYETLL